MFQQPVCDIIICRNHKNPIIKLFGFSFSYYNIVKDAREGMTAFLERRKPTFRNR